jgi:hypothetical protein
MDGKGAWRIRGAPVAQRQHNPRQRLHLLMRKICSDSQDHLSLLGFQPIST